MTRLHRWASRFVSRLKHPDIASMLQWAEGNANPRIDAHLAWCGDCQEHALLLRGSIQTFHVDAATTAILEDVFETLQFRMRRVHNGRRHVATAVEHYFGKQAVRKLGSFPYRDASQEHLISTAKPLFDAFLGRKAADALTSRLASAA